MEEVVLSDVLRIVLIAEVMRELDEEAKVDEVVLVVLLSEEVEELAVLLVAPSTEDDGLVTPLLLDVTGVKGFEMMLLLRADVEELVKMLLAMRPEL